MNDILGPKPGMPQQHERDLADMQKKVDSARALLVRLLQALVVVEHQAGRNAPAEMLEANEQLVLSSLRHQAAAESAAQALTAVSRSAGLDPLTQLPNRELLLDRNAELREANERLVLAALGAQELQAAAERARQRQDELMAVVTQELKNPLAPVRLAAAMLGRASSAEPLLPLVQSIIERQAQHMAQLVDAVHDVASAEAGTLKLEREDVDLLDIVDAAVSGCRASMDARHQHFSAQLPCAAVTAVKLQGDKARLQLVVGNLLDNATKYTPDGGEIRLALDVAADAAVLTVSDNGIGITAQALPEIFEPFASDTHALGFNGVGRGIGLAVVRALVEAHGGTVRAFSEGNMRGSRFVVTLALPGEADAAQVVTPAGGA